MSSNKRYQIEMIIMTRFAPLAQEPRTYAPDSISCRVNTDFFFCSRLDVLEDNPSKKIWYLVIQKCYPQLHDMTIGLFYGAFFF